MSPDQWAGAGLLVGLAALGLGLWLLLDLFTGGERP